jgi:hypothetical protein
MPTNKRIVESPGVVVVGGPVGAVTEPAVAGVQGLDRFELRRGALGATTVREGVLEAELHHGRKESPIIGGMRAGRGAAQPIGRASPLIAGEALGQWVAQEPKAQGQVMGFHEPLGGPAEQSPVAVVARVGPRDETIGGHPDEVDLSAVQPRPRLPSRAHPGRQ